MFDYEELQMIVDSLEMNMAIRNKLIADTKRGELSYIESQKSLRNKCLNLMNKDEFHETLYYDGMDEF